MGVAAHDVRPPRSLGPVVLATALAVVAIVVLALCFLGVVGVIWAGIAVGALIVALAVLAVRRANAIERRAGEPRELD